MRENYTKHRKKIKEQRKTINKNEKAEQKKRMSERLS